MSIRPPQFISVFPTLALCVLLAGSMCVLLAGSSIRANQPVPMVGEPERTLFIEYVMATACSYIMNPTPKPITQEEMALLNNPEAYRAYAMRQGIPQDVTREMKTHADGTPCIDEDCVCTEPETTAIDLDPFVDWSAMKNF